MKKALNNCGYKNWSFQRAFRKRQHQHEVREPPKGYTCVPYVKGLSEAFRRCVSKFGFRVAFKNTNTIKSQIVHPKDKSERGSKCGVVYRINCTGCTAEYWPDWKITE